MPVIDGRPPLLDAWFRPGNTFTVELTWPAGELAGRSFTATLDAATALTVAVDGDTMTVTATDAQTTTLGLGRHTFVLTETTGGGSEEVIVGTWVGTNSARASASAAATVTVNTSAATVTVEVTPPVAGLAAVVAAAHPAWVTVPSGWQDRVQATLAEAATRQVIVRAWGGSITAGSPGPSDPLATSWLALVGAALTATWGDGGTGYVPAILATRVGSWSSRVGFAGSDLRLASAGSATWTVTGTTVRLFHRNDLTGTFRYRIDSGTWTNVTPPTGFGGRYNASEVTGLADTAHTVEVEWVSGTIGIAGVEATRSTGIVMQRAAISGRAVSQYARQIVRRRVPVTITDTSTSITGSFLPEDEGRYIHPQAGTGFPEDVTIAAVTSSTTATLSAAATATGDRVVDLGQVAPSQAAAPTDTVGNIFVPGLGNPDLVIVGTGVNDGGYTEADPASYSEGLGEVLAGARHALILSEHHAAFADYGWATAFRGLAAGMAAAVDGAFVDIWSKGRRSFTYWDGLGYFADSVHPNDAGSVVYAEDVIDLLIP